MLDRCPKVWIGGQLAFIEFQEENIRPFSFFNFPWSPEQHSWVVQTLFEPDDIDFFFTITNKVLVNNFICFLIFLQNIFNNIFYYVRFSLFFKLFDQNLNDLAPNNWWSLLVLMVLKEAIAVKQSIRQCANNFSIEFLSR